MCWSVLYLPVSILRYEEGNVTRKSWYRAHWVLRPTLLLLFISRGLPTMYEGVLRASHVVESIGCSA